MNMDREIDEFLQEEKRTFENIGEESSLYPTGKNCRKGKGRVDESQTDQETLREKWRTRGRKELKVGCHNVNGLKTKGWKIDNLLAWAEEESIAVLGLTETNLAEREGKFLTRNASTKFV